MPDDVQQKFIEAYDAHADAIFRYCYYRLFDREKAKDCVQEAYSRVWRYLSEGHQIDNIRAFIYKTANHIIIDESRKKKAVSLNQLMEKGYTPKSDPRQRTADYLEGKELIEVVKTLDKKYRDALLLKYVDDLSTKEIAFVLNETENNVYVRLSRGLKKVKAVLKEKEKQSQAQLLANQNAEG